jgi:hypothetical protein
MKKRGILCCCLALIMLMGLYMPVVATSGGDRLVIMEEFGNTFVLEPAPIQSNTETDLPLRGIHTVSLGTVLSFSVTGWWDVWAGSFYDGQYEINDKAVEPWPGTITGDMIKYVFDIPGLFLLWGGIDGWFAIYVVDQAAPPQQPPATTQPSGWAATQVNAAITTGLVPQNLQTNYTQATTRAEFAALAVYLFENQRGTITGRSEFADTNDVNVQKAAYIGVVQGVGNNRFAPNDTLTREQAAVMLARLANAIGQPLPPSAPTFADNAQVSSWAVPSVGQMQASGVMGGVGNNQFAPRGDYTREQSIVTIFRLFEMLS